MNLPGEFGTGLALMNYSPLDRFLPNFVQANRDLMFTSGLDLAA